MLEEALGGKAELVMSDMAANTVGHKQTDHLRTMGLVEAGAWFAIENLAPGGTYLAKVLAGGTDTDLLNLLKQHFKTVKTRQAACEPQGLERVVRHRPRVQGRLRPDTKNPAGAGLLVSSCKRPGQSTLVAPSLSVAALAAATGWSALIPVAASGPSTGTPSTGPGPAPGASTSISSSAAAGSGLAGAPP